MVQPQGAGLGMVQGETAKLTRPETPPSCLRWSLGHAPLGHELQILSRLRTLFHHKLTSHAMPIRWAIAIEPSTAPT